MAQLSISCWHCGRSALEAKIKKFGLIVNGVWNPRTHRETTRGAGSIMLCEGCWRNGPAKGMRRHRG